HVAGVRVRLLLTFLPLAVDGVEPRSRQEDLASHFEPARHALSPQREGNRLDRAHVRRHVVAADAVTTGHAAYEPSVLVVQGDRQPVDLRLRDVVDRPLPDLPEDPLLELPQLLL